MASPPAHAACWSRPAASGAEPKAWVLHDGKAGMRSQALGLAEATGCSFVEKPLRVHPPWSILPPQLWLLPRYAISDGNSLLAPPWPDFVIACGRNAAVPALTIRRASGGHTFLAQIQDPRVRRSEFDLIVVPEHDQLRGPGVIVTRGAVHRVTAARLETERRRFPSLAALPRPIVVALIGGANKAYRLTLGRLSEVADALAALLSENGGSLLLTPSRRTGERGITLLRAPRRPPGCDLGRCRRQPLFCLSRARRRGASDRRFGLDDQRGGGDRQTRARSRPRRRRREI